MNRRCWKKRKAKELETWYEEMVAKGILDDDETDDDDPWSLDRHLVWINTG
jgi:hypothetical protein